MSAALRTDRLTRRFGELAAVDGVSLELARGERHALIGPNGAGKTTLINLLTGALAPTSCEVFIGETRVTACTPHERVKRGLARTFQVTNLFANLTVLESVLLAIHERKAMGAQWHRAWTGGKETLDEARALLAALHLEAHAATPTAQLPYGRQRIVEIALALASAPSILLLDEPAAGIPSGESEDVLRVVAALPGEVTILFIEHDMDVVFRYAQRVTVLVAGRVLAQGAPEEIARDARVRAVYLGVEA